MEFQPTMYLVILEHKAGQELTQIIGKFSSLNHANEFAHNTYSQPLDAAYTVSVYKLYTTV